MDGLAMAYLAVQQYTEACTVIDEAVMLLPTVVDAPNYAYLVESLANHRAEAQRGLGG
jgi:hypothetical protein